MNIRVHEFLEAITPDSVGLDLQSLDLLTVFQGFDLLPDLNADLTSTDADVLALFAFCRWTLSWDNTPATVARRLQGQGVTTWAPPATSSPQDIQPVGVVELRGGAHYALNYQDNPKKYPDLITWLGDVFSDMEEAMRLESLQLDKTRCTATALFTDGERYTWASPGGAQRVTKIERVTIENTPNTTAGKAPFWTVAGRLSGWVKPQPMNEATPRAALRGLSIEGNTYKLKK